MNFRPGIQMNNFLSQDLKYGLLKVWYSDILVFRRLIDPDWNIVFILGVAISPELPRLERAQNQFVQLNSDRQEGSIWRLQDKGQVSTRIQGKKGITLLLPFFNY